MQSGFLQSLNAIFGKPDENSNMHGYDTVDYYEINPYFGTKTDLAALISACHERGMKIIFDFVPNHTSTEHQWFKNSKAGLTVDGVDYSDWYVWSDTKYTMNNGMRSSDSSWHTTSSSQKKYYYGCFDSGMPDLNYNNPDVREAMKSVARHWLEFGFDGLRLDGARYLCEENGVACDANATHEFYKELRQVVDEFESPKFMVCEAWLEGDRTKLDKYLGNDDEFNVAFDFDQGNKCVYSVFEGKDSTGDTMRRNPTALSSYGTFLGNHDEYTVYKDSKSYIRYGSALNQDPSWIRQAIGLSLMRPTIPFIYYGNEFGMPEYGTSGDMRARGPMKWNPDENQIMTTAMNKAFIDVRKAYPETFQSGDIVKLSTGKQSIMAYILTGEDAKLLCVYNLSNDSCESVTLNVSCSSADLLIGGGSNVSELETGSSITVKNLGPRAVRVYLLNDDDGKTPYYSDEKTYGEKYETPVVSKYSSVNLMGTVTDWTNGEQMDLDKSSGECVWSIEKTLTGGKEYQFKFMIDGNWTGGNSVKMGTGIKDDGSSNHNMLYTPSDSGTYRFTFNEAENKVTVTKV